MLRKTYTVTPELKQEGEGLGLVTARFATLNVVDSDGDITLPGAFGEQTVRMQPYGHVTRNLPIGKGRIYEDGDAALAELHLNLELGRDHYSALKFDMEHGEPLIEWSYVFDVIESEQETRDGEEVRLLKKMKVYSVDPVFLGAGVNTGTVSVKSRHGACDVCGGETPAEALKACTLCDPAATEGWLRDEHGIDLKLATKLAFVPGHRTAAADRDTTWKAPTLADFTDEAWDDLPDAEKRRIAGHYTGSKTTMPPERFSDLFGPHHQPTKTGTGPAVWRAVSSGRMMQLGDAITGAAGFRRHIGGHYRQFSETPPWVESSTAGIPFDERFEEAEHALCDVRGFVSETDALCASLKEKGETLSDRKRSYIEAMRAEMSDLDGLLAALLNSEPEGEPPKAAAGLVAMRRARGFDALREGLALAQ